MDKATAAPQKVNIPKTMLIGTAFAGVSIAFAIFTPYFTIMLDHFLSLSPVVSDWSTRLAGIPLLESFMASQGYGVGERFTIIPLLIGVVMTFIYIMGMIFQPISGKISDNWRSRFGKRRPFIVVLMPLSAIFFVLMPFSSTLTTLMISMMIFSFLMAIYRVPTVSLMPDLTPSELRSGANAYISLMGGLGTILGMGAGMLFELIIQPDDQFDIFPHVFIFGAVIMLICTGAMYFVKEKDSRLPLDSSVLNERQAADAQRSKKEIKAAEKKEKLSPKERKSLYFMLAGLFFLFSGSNVIQTFFALFAAEILHRDVTFATILMALFAICAAGGAIPAGILGRKFGRRNTMIAGLALIMVSLIVFFGVFMISSSRNGMNLSQYTTLNHAYVDVIDQAGEQDALEFITQNPAQFTHLVSMANDVFDTDYTQPAQAFARIEAAIEANLSVFNAMIIPVLVVAGFASMLFMVNAMPLVVELGGKKRVGTFTGYYYIATYSAQIISPIAYGFFRIFTGSYISMFYYVPVLFVASAAAMLFVRHGEANKDNNPTEDDAEPLPAGGEEAIA